MSLRDITARASKAALAVLGASCTYHFNNGDDDKLGVNIFIDRNKQVKDEFNMVIGYRVIATFQKSDIPSVENNDEFTNDLGERFRINQVDEETTSKWYVTVTEQF